MVSTRFWVHMATTNSKSYPFVIQLFVEVADVLSSADYREFDGKFLDGHEYMAHILITYLFNIFSLSSFEWWRYRQWFVTLCGEWVRHDPSLDTSHDPQEVSFYSPFFSFLFFLSSLLIPLSCSLLDQLQLYVAISSLKTLFAKKPLLFYALCPKLTWTTNFQRNSDEQWRGWKQQWGQDEVRGDKETNRQWL